MKRTIPALIALLLSTVIIQLSSASGQPVPGAGSPGDPGPHGITGVWYGKSGTTKWIIYRRPDHTFAEKICTLVSPNNAKSFVAQGNWSRTRGNYVLNYTSATSRFWNPPMPPNVVAPVTSVSPGTFRYNLNGQMISERRLADNNPGYFQSTTLHPSSHW